MYRAVVVQEVLQRRQEPWRGGAQWSTIGSWQWPTENHHQSWSSYNHTRKLLKNSMSTILRLFLAFEANWKGEKAQLSGSLMSWLKKSSFFSAVFSIRLQRVLKSGISMTTGNNQLSGWTEKQLQSTSQGETCTRKGHGHCSVVCCPSEPLQPSESWQNHYIWEVCSANRWDALKTAVSAASIGEPKGPNSSRPQCLSTHHTTYASEVERIWLLLPHWLYSPTSRQPPTTSSSTSITFCRENASTTSRMQKMLSKSSSNSEAQIFMLQE